MNENVVTQFLLAIYYTFLWFIGSTTQDVGRTREEIVSHELKASDLQVFQVLFQQVVY